MKRHSLMVAAAIVLLLSAGSAYAQSELCTFKVPFSFVVGETVLTAGEYHITKDRAPGTLQLWGSDRHTILVFAGDIQTLDASTQTKLVFHRYDDRYFLSQLWIEGQNRGREVPIGREERQIARKNGPKSTAVIASTNGDKGGK